MQYFIHDPFRKWMQAELEILVDQAFQNFYFWIFKSFNYAVIEYCWPKVMHN